MNETVDHGQCVLTARCLPRDDRIVCVRITIESQHLVSSKLNFNC